MEIAAIKRRRDIETEVRERRRHPHESIDIRNPPGDVMCHAGTRIARSMVRSAEKVHRNWMVERPVLESNDGSLLARRPKPEHVEQEARHMLKAVGLNFHGSDSTDRAIRRSGRRRIARDLRTIGIFHQGEFETIRVSEAKMLVPKRPCAANDSHPALGKAAAPVRKSAGRHGQDDRTHLAVASPTLRGTLVNQECQKSAGSSAFGTAVEVQHGWLIKVHGPFNKPKAKRPCVKVECAAGICADGGDVM